MRLSRDIQVYNIYIIFISYKRLLYTYKLEKKNLVDDTRGSLTLFE